MSDEQVERLLSGVRRIGEDTELEELLGVFKRTYSAPPSEAARGRHLPAIRAAAHAAAARERRGRRAGVAALGARLRPTGTRARVALAGAALLLLAPSSAAGLATAGVVLPESVQAPFESLGVELPNQSTADEVHAVIEATPPEERGCEFGLEVAKAASGGRVPDRAGCPEDGAAERSQRGGREGAGAPGRGRGGPPKSVPPGHAAEGGARARRGGDAASGGRSHGQQRAGEARQSPPPNGGDVRPEPSPPAPSKPVAPGGGRAAPGPGGVPPTQAPGSGGGSAAPDGAPSPPSSAPRSGPQAGSRSGQAQEAGPGRQRSSTDVR